MRVRASTMWRAALVAVAISVVATVAAPAARAACAKASEEEHFARATVVFEGIAQPGDTADGALLSPATFQVERYLKGDGPRELQVATATSEAGGGLYATMSTGIHPAAGERWRIFATGPTDEVVATSTCHGSRRIAPAAADVAAAPHDDPDLAGSDGSSPVIPLLLIMVLPVAAISVHLIKRSTGSPPAENSP